MKRLIFLLLLIPQICFAQTMISNRDIKQHPATKLFISGNHLVSDFEDVSSSNNQITKYADVKTVNETSTNNPKYFPIGNDKGIYFDGSGDYLTLNTTGTDDFTFPAGTDFTIDFWIYPIGTLADKVILSKYTTWASNIDMYIDFNANSTMSFVFANANIGINTNIVFSANKWYHVSLIRSGTECKVFVNGIYDNNDVTSNFDVTNNQTTMKIGTNITDNFSGFLQNIRISKGIARWTSSFIPPALNSTYATDSYTKLYIKGHDKPVNTTAMTDDSGTSKTITTVGDTKVGYSRGVASYFDGTGDWITIPDSTDLEVGSDDFTFEFWFQNTRQIASSVNYVSGKYLAEGNQRGYIFSLAATDEHFQFDYSKTGADVYTMVTSATTVNKWHHICFVKNGTNILLFLDGVLQETDTGVTSIFGGTALFSVGCVYNNSLYAQGFCSGLRVSKGIARYTSNFTPPETEPVPDQYTKLLLKQKMLKIPDIATNKAITINGQTMTRNFAKAGKSSIYFDGSGDYLLIGDYTDWDLDGDFTIDFWVYLNSTQYQRFIIPYTANSSEFSSYCLSYSDGNFYCMVSSNRTAYNIMLATTPAAQNTWYHLALVRSGNNYNFYKNGISVATASTISSPAFVTTHMNIGRRSVSDYEYAFGHLQDIRITKGKALWTSNFTPPRRSGAY